MYLTLAAIISASLQGIDNPEPLEWKANAMLEHKEDVEEGRKLPHILDDALSELEAVHDELGEMMGERSSETLPLAETS